jgi:hypothetical protein
MYHVLILSIPKYDRSFGIIKAEWLLFSIVVRMDTPTLFAALIQVITTCPWCNLFTKMQGYIEAAEAMLS